MAYDFFLPIIGYDPIPVGSPVGDRTDPVKGGLEHHRGIDIPVPRGTPIWASERAKIIRIDRADDPNSKNPNNGNAVIAVGDSGMQWAWLHMLAVTPYLKKGDVLRRGEQVGWVGNTGKVAGKGGGYHLHLQVEEEGQVVDPVSLFPDGTFSRSAVGVTPRDLEPADGGLVATLSVPDDIPLEVNVGGTWLPGGRIPAGHHTVRIRGVNVGEAPFEAGWRYAAQRKSSNIVIVPIGKI